MGKLSTIIGVALIFAGAVFAPLAAVGASMVLNSALNRLLGPKAPKPQPSEQQVKAAASPRVYGYGTRRVYGNVDFYGNSPDGGTVDVISYVDGRANAIRAVYLNDEVVTISAGSVVALPDGSYADGVVKAGFNLGLDTETAFAPVIAKLPGIWTTGHRGDGVVTGYVIKEPVKSKVFLEVYPQGDNVQMSLVIDLQLCFDPREMSHDVDDPSTWEWTENAVLHFLHYLIVRRGYNYETRILPQIDKWITAANIADEAMALNAGGTEPRYRGCVLYDSTAKPHEVIGSLIEPFDGWYCQNELGEVVVYAGAWYEPTVTIGPEHIVEYSHQANVLDEDRYNEFSIKYFSALHDYNQPECQPWRDETDISERGSVNSQGIEPQVPSFTQARRLAKILAARENAPDRGQVKTNFSGRIALGERFINLHIEEAGAVIYSGYAEIKSVVRHRDTGGITFEWVRADPNAYAWNPATEDGYGAPTGTFPTIEPLDAPTIDDLTAGDDGVALDITGPDRTDLTWFAHWRVAGASVWGPDLEYPDIDDTPAVQLVIGGLPVGAEVEFEVAYQVGDGRVSPWSNIESITLDEIEYDGGGA